MDFFSLFSDTLNAFWTHIHSRTGILRSCNNCYATAHLTPLKVIFVNQKLPIVEDTLSPGSGQAEIGLDRIRTLHGTYNCCEEGIRSAGNNRETVIDSWIVSIHNEDTKNFRNHNRKREGPLAGCWNIKWWKGECLEGCKVTDTKSAAARIIWHFLRCLGTKAKDIWGKAFGNKAHNKPYYIVLTRGKGKGLCLGGGKRRAVSCRETRKQASFECGTWDGHISTVGKHDEK